PKEEPVPDDMQSDVESYREQLIESIAEADDDLLAKFLEGEELNQEQLRSGLKEGVLQGKIVPILVGSASSMVGVQGLLDALVDYVPSPADRAPREAMNRGEKELVPAESTGPLVAQVFKTTA